MPGSAKERVLMLYFNTNVGATLFCSSEEVLDSSFF